MHRFVLSSGEGMGAVAGTRLTLGPEDSHHAARVLRLGPGDEVEGLDGSGGVLACRVAGGGRHALEVEVRSVRRQTAPMPVALAPALLKGRAMDFLIQKATELGATSIAPLLTARTVARVADGETAGRVADWTRTAREACKQCGNAWMPRIEAPVGLDRYLAGAREVARDALRVAAMLRPEARWPGQVLDEAEAALRSGPMTLITGPEGDFTPEEEQSLIEAGVHPITLGPLVLRAETAVVAGLAVLQHERARRTGG